MDNKTEEWSSMHPEIYYVQQIMNIDRFIY